ncbi:MAG: DUF971 domain-containing protein [SAR202 cluster bacterium]|jgi:DUF971 family protein|nr:DUF971 domain-containing protein [SAR202 cluster bacterium]|tara:strand:+ start:607 stop:939 length:333 start_codon:yes stop_codon:yes gene_type:complete
MMATGIGVNNVTIDGQNIHIEWNDGHKSEWTATSLRISCGCAQCVEEWSRRQLLDPASVPLDLKAEDYLMVGRYAVQFLWSDGHFTGIFPFDVLRDLCNCDVCKAEREDE